MSISYFGSRDSIPDLLEARIACYMRYFSFPSHIPAFGMSRNAQSGFEFVQENRVYTGGSDS